MSETPQRWTISRPTDEWNRVEVMPISEHLETLKARTKERRGWSNRYLPVEESYAELAARHERLREAADRVVTMFDSGCLGWSDIENLREAREDS